MQLQQRDKKADLNKARFLSKYKTKLCTGIPSNARASPRRQNANDHVVKIYRQFHISRTFFKSIITICIMSFKVNFSHINFAKR